MKRFFVAFLLIVLLTACGGVSPDSPVANEPGGTEIPVENPYAPQPGDEALTRGNVYLDTSEILVLESFPLQFVLHVTGNLPDPCHALRYVVGQPDGQNNIEIELYSVADPDTACIQVLEPIDQSIPLGSFPAGHYTVSVNEEQVGEFDA